MKAAVKRGGFTKAKQPVALKGLAPFLVLNDLAQGVAHLCEDQILAERAADLSPALCQIIFQKLHRRIGATGLMRHVAEDKLHFHTDQSANSKHFSSQV